MRIFVSWILPVEIMISKYEDVDCETMNQVRWERQKRFNASSSAASICDLFMHAGLASSVQSSESCQAISTGSCDDDVR